MSIWGPMRCLCCGAREQTGGCLRMYFPCDCKTIFTPMCARCFRCSVHCRCAHGPASLRAVIAEKRQAREGIAHGRERAGDGVV